VRRQGLGAMESRMSPGKSRRLRARGFTYVWAMAALAIFALGLAAVGPLFAADAQREREQELLRIGRLYAQAIADYHAASPGSVKRYPPSLDALLADTRFVGTVRHLRRLYPDPMQPDRPWGLVRAADGSIRGLYSAHEGQPLRTAAVDLGVVVLPPARRYSDWQFSPLSRP
jgi:type II secretory pathway pseudopilin PulG